MIISWYGQFCFKIQTGEKVVLIDPYSPRNAGLRGPNYKATILVLTNPEEIKIAQKDSKDECFLISGPGEYESKNIFVYGTDAGEDKKPLTIYQIIVDNIRIGVLGEINKTLTDGQLEKLDGIDVLLIPIGGKGMIDAEKAVKIVHQIEPKITIPCCYKIKGLKVSLDPLDNFLKEAGAKNPETMEKLSLHKKDLEQIENKIIILEPK
ncbi:MAG: MBL fold metallo-hydrolase [Patescibacteria group bacterium]|nr:MBL fold metallo-hydrolase [Patescibacteria group bacterium]